MKEKSLLANELVRQRKKHNLTQTAVGKIVGLTAGSVAHWENNRRKPKENVLEKLEEVYGLKKGYFNHFLQEEKVKCPFKEGNYIYSKDNKVIGKVTSVENNGAINIKVIESTDPNFIKNERCKHLNPKNYGLLEYYKERIFKVGDVVYSTDKRVKAMVTADCYEGDTYFKGIVIESSYTDIPAGFEDNWVADVFKIYEKEEEKITIFKKGDVVITNKDFYPHLIDLKIEVLENCLLGDNFFSGKVLETSDDFDYPIGRTEDFITEKFKLTEEKKKNRLIRQKVFFVLKKGDGYISNLMTAKFGEITTNINHAMKSDLASKRYKNLAKLYDAKIVKIVQTFEEVEND